MTVAEAKPAVKLRVYHCGNWLGLWAEGAAWWCRRCQRLIDSHEALALISR